MDWKLLNTYGLAPDFAFETVCTQLFERYLMRNHGSKLVKFRVINGSGGDGGIEAYGELKDGVIKAVQAKWFLNAMSPGEINNIKKSINTAKKIRPSIKEYFILIPHNVHSIKTGKGKKVITKSEEDKVNILNKQIAQSFPDLKITWWFSDRLLKELQMGDNEGVHKFWFEKEIISFNHLLNQFTLQKENEWLKARYVPELHGKGIISNEYHKAIFSSVFRENLCNKLKERENSISSCSSLIEKFISTNAYSADLGKELRTILKNMEEMMSHISSLSHEIGIGNNRFQILKLRKIKIHDTIEKLHIHKSTNRQKAILPQLIFGLTGIYAREIIPLTSLINRNVTFFKGDFGTGKTHGLADCVDTQLKVGAPALIIQAKGTPCRSWTDILANVLELNNWNKESIFSALESLAIQRDHTLVQQLESGDELDKESSKAVICVDGLDEDNLNETNWCDRIREAVIISKQYPRVCFLFSARSYFNNGRSISEDSSYIEINLPREGDVPVFDVAQSYFSHYRIQLSDMSLISGLDSLLSLRLFCEKYKDRSLTIEDVILTTTGDLLQSKVQELNHDFIIRHFPQKTTNEEPVISGLLAIAKYFFSNAEIKHAELKTLLQAQVGDVLNGLQIDSLIDFLSINGILIRIYKIDNSEVLTKKIFYYRISYQSIVDYLIAEQIYLDIKNERIHHIPNKLHEDTIWPLTTGEDIFNPWRPPSTSNQTIIKSIATKLFVETGRLIGEQDFLVTGFSTDALLEIKFGVLSAAPYSKSIQYKNLIDSLFFAGPKSLFLVLKYLIIPSAQSLDTAFGAEYLHDILYHQVSVFERDKLWSGADHFEQLNYQNEEDREVFGKVLYYALLEFERQEFHLSEFQFHNQLPLLYAWAMTTIDQELRDGLRIGLAGWAIKRPDEYLLLLDKIFLGTDPQVQEDLSSIALAIATKINDKIQLKLLADWAIKNIFNKKEDYNNIIIRQGFRAVVEKAYKIGSISFKLVKNCRPGKINNIKLLPLDNIALNVGTEQIYPIVHDLAWYVIDNAYKNFLEFPDKTGKAIKDNDSKEAKALLDLYRKHFNKQDIYAHEWAMAAAIGYIRSVLGFTRKKGNSWTKESHGGKSKIYTYEEKYTWLAVHYLQGYLSDHIPLKNFSGDNAWTVDYSQLTEIPNPAEMITSFKKNLLEIKSHWIIPEDLTVTIEGATGIETKIKAWVNSEPIIDFSKWLFFLPSVFPDISEGRKWVALYNDTGLHDSSESIYGNIRATACVIKKNEFPALKKIISIKKGDLFFVRDLKNLQALPDTQTYSNPSDIVWMDWINEDNSSENFTINKSTNGRLDFTVAKITQSTLQGERYYSMPSKFIRNVLKIQSFDENQFRDQNDHVISFIHKLSEGGTKDLQELLLVDYVHLYSELKKRDLKLIWFVEIFRRKNQHNKNLSQSLHSMKTRKYLVYEEGKKLHHIKFWDKYFSN